MMFRNTTVSDPNSATCRALTRRLRALPGLALLVWACCVASDPVSAQRAARDLASQAAQEKTPSSVKPTITVDEASSSVRFALDSKGGMPLLDFVKWAQEVTGKRFTFHYQELVSGGAASNIHFVGELAMKRETLQEDFFSFFQTMLLIKGFAVVPRGTGDQELFEIVMMNGARGREVGRAARYVAVADLAKYEHQAGVPILTTVPLEHIDAQRASNAMRPFFASTGAAQGSGLLIGNVGDKSALLLQGFGPQVYAAAQLLKLVDTPDAMSAGAGSARSKTSSKPKRRSAAQRHGQVSKGSDDSIGRLVAGRSETPSGTRSGGAGGQGQQAMVTFSMKKTDGMELVDFIKWAQEITGKRFTFHPQELTSGSSAGSKIHVLGEFQFPRETFKQDFYAFVQTMLYIKGFAIVPRGDGRTEVLEIVMIHGTRGREIANSARYVAPEDVAKYRNQAGVPILTTVKLNNVNAQLANNALRPFFASAGGSQGSSIQIGNVGDRSALLLQGYGPQVYAAVQLLEIVDGPREDSKRLMQIVRLEHRNAKELESILNKVIQSRSSSGGPAHAGAGEPQPKVIADEPQASLILSGKQHEVQNLLEMIARLDVPARSAEGAASVVYLKHAKAKDVAATLNAFLVDGRPASGRNQAGRTPNRRRTTVITPHEDSNSLLISAPATRWKQIVALVERLDVPVSTAGKQGFGFTRFGQAAFQDTDADGLPDTRLPDFGTPRRGSATKTVEVPRPGNQTKAAKAGQQPSVGKSVVF